MIEEGAGDRLSSIFLMQAMSGKVKELFSSAVTVVLVLCAVIITVLVVRRELFTPAPASSAATSVTVLEASVWADLPRQGHRTGPADAGVEIVEFYDYECPFCRRAQTTLAALRARYPDEVAVIHRHFPLSIHPQAVPAAIAVECAGAQGRFEAYHALLFEAQDALAQAPWDRLAEAAAVPDLARFRACVEAEAPAQQVETDRRLVESLGIRKIPSLIVNGTVYAGALRFEELERIVEQALAERP